METKPLLRILTAVEKLHCRIYCRSAFYRASFSRKSLDGRFNLVGRN